MSQELKQWAEQAFRNDRFAMETTGIVIEDVEENYARCSLAIRDSVLNAAGSVMGGAIFTLADFTFAIASNTAGMGTVSLSSQINFLKPPVGEKIIAESDCLKSSGRTCYFVIKITDCEGTVALVSATGYRTRQ